MSNEVKIKLSADGKQVRDEIKLIDKDLQGLGGTSPIKNPTQSPKTDKSSGSVEGKQQSGTDKLHQESRDRTERQSVQETSLLRKEIQKLNEKLNSNNGGGGNTPPPSSGGGTSSSGLPSGGSGGSGNENTSKIGQLLGKVGTVLAAVGTVTKVLQLASHWQSQSQSSQSTAYQTYGSTLWYDDYGNARKNATNLGISYGYDYDQTMAAANANLSRAGVTGDTVEEQQQNYKTDMNAILKTSKAWGINATALSDTSGFMTSIGVTKGGDQQKFANILAQSIVDAEMTGRENEQLQVLEQIADTLSDNAATVNENSLTGSLNMYNALVAQNENLKGTRGSSIVSTAADVAASGDTSLDILAGFGTEYTGLKGKLELRRLAENDPEQYWKQVYQNYTKMYGEDNLDPLINKMASSLGSVSKADELVASWKGLSEGKYDSSNTTEGENATDERIKNYNDSSLSGAEKFDASKKEAEATLGDAGTGLKGMFGNWFSSLSPGWQTVLTGAGEVAPVVGAGAAVSKGFGWLKGKLGNASKAVPDSFGSYVDDILDAYNNAGDIDGVLSKVAKNGNVTDDIYKWSDELVDALNAGASNSDDIIRQGYQQFGKTFAENTGESTSFIDKILKAFSKSGDDAASGAASGLDDAAKAASSATSGLDDAARATSGLSGLDDAARAASGLGDVASSGASGIDDALNAAGKAASGVDDALGAAGKAAGGVDDALSAAGKAAKGTSLLGKAGKALGIIGTAAEVISTGVDVGTAIKDKDYREAAQETGGGIGSLAGGAGGAAGGAALGATIGSIVPGLGTAIGGAIGGIIGGIGGGIGGDKLGEALGEGVYDLTTDKPTYTDDQKAQIAKYYDKVSELYNEKGNNAAQDYTNDIVVPYLNSIGVSKSITDAYKWDVGKPDFMKDVENEKFGSLTQEDEDSESGKLNGAIDDNISALEENTQAIEDMISSNSTASKDKDDKVDSLQTDKGSNSKTTGSGNWFTNLFKSHAVGNDYVPYDNYLASLHKGEMVLNKFDADQYRQGTIGTTPAVATQGASGSIDLNIKLSGSIAGMTPENQDKIVQTVVSKLKGSNIQSLLSNGFTRIQNN